MSATTVRYYPGLPATTHRSLWHRLLYRESRYYEDVDDEGRMWYWRHFDERWPSWAFWFVARLAALGSMAWERFWR